MWKLAICLFAFTAACSDDSNGDDDVGPGGDGGTPGFTDGVSTLAGSGEAGFVDGERAISRFNNPVNAIVGPDGMVVVADFDNSKIRVVDPQTGATRTLIDPPSGVNFVAFDRRFQITCRSRCASPMMRACGARFN